MYIRLLISKRQVTRPTFDQGGVNHLCNFVEAMLSTEAP